MFSRLITRNSRVGARSVHTHTQSLSERVRQLVPSMRQHISDVKKKYGDKSLGDTTVAMALGGMRGIKGLVTETSLLDAEKGITFRGYTIPQLQELLPKAKNNGSEPLPEGLLWLLLTGEIPSEQQVRQLTAELHHRSHLPEHVRSIINKFPKHMHPMTQLCSAVCLLQTESQFAQAYQRGVNKSTYWEYYLEDSLNLIARLPEVAAMIYRNTFHNGKHIASDHNLDYGSNFAHMLGYNNQQFHELMRLYLVIHSDHEGGNVSAHATHLVGSALSDPYLSYCAGMTGLAGPLHGLANQEVLRWLTEFKQQFKNDSYTKDELIAACWKTLNEGRVIPGYGHAVLRRTDPRYSSQREFALKHLPNDKMFKLVSDLYEVVPDVLTKHGKTANPWPNVDAHSGVLLQHYGMTEAEYYTVLFGVSRAMGVLSSLIIDRIYGFPIERPKSITTQWIEDKFKTAA